MMKNKLINNKRGWVKIIEAFISILFLMGVILVVMNSGKISNDSDLKDIYNKELIILREIQLNETLRTEILNADASVNWDDFPTDTKAKIIEKIPTNFECQAKICPLEDSCIMEGQVTNFEVYAKSIVISANSDTYNPKQLKLFCWGE